MPLVEHELLCLPKYLSSPPFFSGASVDRSSVLCVMFCRSLFVLLSFFFCSLCCLPSLYLRILITPLVSSNSSQSLTSPDLFLNYLLRPALLFCLSSKFHLRMSSECCKYIFPHLDIHNSLFEDIPIYCQRSHLRNG